MPETREGLYRECIELPSALAEAMRDTSGDLLNSKIIAGLMVRAFQISRSYGTEGTLPNVIGELAQGDASRQDVLLMIYRESFRIYVSRYLFDIFEKRIVEAVPILQEAVRRAIDGMPLTE